MTPELKRRTFLVGVAAVMTNFMVGGVAYALNGDEELLRPLGGQDEERFIGACLKCDRCRSICPQSCITISVLSDGLVNARTPHIDFRKNYCTFCGKCVEVCPTAALAEFDKTIDKIGIAVVNEDECIAFNHGGCQKCVDTCDYDAIALNDAGQPVVDENKCNGCGICEFVCPSSTMTSYSGSKYRGINVVKAGGSIAINGYGEGQV